MTACLFLALPTAAEAQAEAGVPCPPSATLEGDPATVAELASELSSRGIVAGPVPDCPVVRVRIEPGATGFVIEVVVPDGRSTERTVARVETAAALIESWARTDLTAELLEGGAAVAELSPGVSGTGVEEVAPASDAVAPPASVPSPAAETPAADPASSFRLALAAEAGVAEDASTWFGGALSGCVVLGPTCLGAMVRVAADPGLTGDAATQDAYRLEAEVFVGLDFPLRFGDVGLLPGAGIGVGWLRSATTSAAGGADEVDAGGLRVEAHFGVSYALGWDLALDLVVSADVSPLAHRDPWVEEGVTIAGEPLVRGQVGVGIHYGVP